MILEHLNKSGIQQAHHRCGRVDGRRGVDHHQDGRISSTALNPWPNDLICAEGRYGEREAETGTERRAGNFIGPESGTVAPPPDLVSAAREAADADFDVLIACALSYGAHAYGRAGS